MLEDLYNKHIGRGKAGFKGTTYTEKDIQNKQLDEIDKQVRYVVSKHPKINGDYFKKHPNDTIRLAVNQGKVQPKLYGSTYADSGLANKFSPNGQVSTTLGSYNVDIYKDGYTVKDVYDFNHDQGHYKNNNKVYPTIRRFMGKYGHSDLDDNKSKTKFKIKRKVNHW